MHELNQILIRIKDIERKKKKKKLKQSLLCFRIWRNYLINWVKGVELFKQ